MVLEAGGIATGARGFSGLLLPLYACQPSFTIWLRIAENVGLGGSILSYTRFISSNRSFEILTEYGIVVAKKSHYTTLRTSHFTSSHGSRLCCNLRP